MAVRKLVLYKRKFSLYKISMFFAAVAFTGFSYGGDATSLAKQSQNPVSSLIQLPFENNANFNSGKDDKTLNVLNVKPVVPMSLNENWTLISRAIVPVVSQPGVSGTLDDDRKNGLGDTTYQGFFTPAKAGDMIWGVGPQIQIPTHTDSRLGNNRWAAGPTAVFLFMPGKWVYGTLLSQIWDVTNSGNEDISMFTMQPFINYNIGEGWYVVSNPVITADWEADSGDKWTVPLGGGVGRVMHIGKQAMNFRVAVFGNIVKPDYASDFNVQFSATFMFPE